MSNLSKRSYYLVQLLSCGFLLILVACKSNQTGTQDLLTVVQDRGEIRVATDANYAPQSYINENGQFVGFDVDVAREIANRLNVDVKFVTPDWSIVTAGNWGGQFDMHVNSMTLTKTRQEALDFSFPAYYYMPAQVAATNDSNINKLSDLEEQSICVGVSTTYESWLQGDFEALGLPDANIYATPPTSVNIISLPSEKECIQSIQAGRTEFDALIASNKQVEAAIEEGVLIHKVGSPVFGENLSIAFDKNSQLDSTSLIEAVNSIISSMHEDGTLSGLSMEWFGEDLTQDPAE